MKQLRFLFLVIVCFCSLQSAWAADGDVFTAKTVEGVEVSFSVINENEKTCRVGSQSRFYATQSINTQTTGILTIPEEANGYKVIEIGPLAFRRCKGLTEVILPTTIISIKEQSFDGCTGMTSVEIPSNVESIGYEAFGYCSGLTSLYVPKSVIVIDELAFSECSNLTSIVVESGNPKYDSRNNCNAIISTDVNILITGCNNTIIPYGVKGIYPNAFAGCIGLENITIPNSVEVIGYDAFYRTGLKSLTIPKSVTEIYGTLTRGCKNLNRLVVEEGNPIYDSRDNCNAIIETASNKLINACKTTVIPNTVTSIGDEVLFGIPGLTTVIIPDNVITIGRENIYGTDDFEGGDDVQTVVIGSGLSSMGRDNFYNCKNLRDIYCYAPNIPQGGSYKHLTNVTLHVLSEYLDVNKEFAESHNFNLVAITDGDPTPSSYIDNTMTGTCGEKLIWKYDGIAKTLTVSGTGQMSYDEVPWKEIRKDIENVIIEEGVTSIGTQAFSNCTNLSSLTIAEGLRSIGHKAFYKCTSLKTVVLPESVDSIMTDVFANSGLTNLTFPESLSYVGNKDAFDDTPWLESQPDGIVYMGKTLLVYKGEMPEGTSVVVRSGCTMISGGAFRISGHRDREGLVSVSIPEGVTYIGSDAFGYCPNLSTVTLPSSIKFIDISAFSYCNFKDVYCYAETIPETDEYLLQWDTNAAIFYNCILSNATLHVPANAIEAYKVNTLWSGFGSIVPLTDEETSVISVKAEQPDIQYYNLKGVHVDKPGKGLYIVNGKKVVR